MSEWSGSIAGIPVNGGRDLMVFNAIGGSYLVPNPAYGLASAPVEPSFSPYLVSSPVSSYVMSEAPIVPGPGGALPLGYAFSSFAVPTPLQNNFPIQAVDEDAILYLNGFPIPSSGSGATSSASGSHVTTGGVMTTRRRFPWEWVAVGVVAVILLSDERRN